MTIRRPKNLGRGFIAPNSAHETKSRSGLYVFNSKQIIRIQPVRKTPCRCSQLGVVASILTSNANRMNFKRIASILIILLGYIALAGAMHTLINHFTPTKPEITYAELRTDAAKHVQLLLCRNWMIRPEDLDPPGSSTQPETGQDIFYWINLAGACGDELFTNIDVHANGPAPKRIYKGVVRWDHQRNTITLSLHRTAATDIPFGANGTYEIRKISTDPLMTEITN